MLTKPIVEHPSAEPRLTGGCFRFGVSRREPPSPTRWRQAAETREPPHITDQPTKPASAR